MVTLILRLSRPLPVAADLREIASLRLCGKSAVALLQCLKPQRTEESLERGRHSPGGDQKPGA